MTRKPVPSGKAEARISEEGIGLAPTSISTASVVVTSANTLLPTGTRIESHRQVAE